MSQTYSSPVKVEELEAELSAQIHSLRTEIEDKDISHQIFSKPYSSVHIPKDASYFRLERQRVLHKALQVSSTKPVVSQAEVAQREMEICLNQEHKADGLPLLLHQKQITHLTTEFEDCVYRARRLAISREKVLLGLESPIAVITQEDINIYLQWLICHLHSVKHIHNFLHVLHYLLSTEWNDDHTSIAGDLTSPAYFDGVFVSMSELPLLSTNLEDFKVQLDFLLSHYDVEYNTNSIKTTADEMELISLVLYVFRTVFKQQEEMKIFLQYDSTEATDRRFGRKSPNMTLRKQASWIPHIQMKPKRDPWQQKQMAKLKELRLMDELLQMHSSLLEDSDLHKVTDALKQLITSVCQPEASSLKDTSDVWRNIYNTANMLQVTTGQMIRLPKYADQRPSERKSEGCGQTQSACVFEKDEDAVDDSVMVRGAFESLIFLRHLRIRELKRVCLSLLNYLRSVERTLVMDGAGLESVGGDLVRNMEETGWIYAVRKDDGALNSHHFIYNTPVDYKVRCAEFMEFPEVENLHDYYSTDGRFIHTQDQRGLYIVYDVALKDLEELEQNLLLTASHFILKSTDLHTSCGSEEELQRLARTDVDRIAVLLDLWTCEADFLEHKIQLLNCYLEAYQHVTDPEEQFRLAQVITDIMHRRPQMDFTAGYFVQSYRDSIVCLQSHQQLIKLVLNNQIDEQRQYLQRIWRDGQKGSPSEYGLPPNYIPKHLVSIGGSRPALKSVYFLEIHPSLGLACQLYEGLERACTELFELHRAKAPSQRVKLEQKLLKTALHHWHTLTSPGVTYSPQIQRDLFLDVFIEDPALVRDLGLYIVRCADEQERKQGKDRQMFMLETFCTLLELVTLRHRIFESAAETEHLSQLYKSLSRVIGFDEVHLYMRLVQFEFAVRKETPKQLPVFLTALQDNRQEADRFIPNSLPLAVQELDENHICKFSFRSKEAVLQLMNEASVENLRVVLMCQVVQRNALIGALKQASVCFRTEKLDQSSDSDLKLQHEESASSTTRRRAVDDKNRFAGAFVSIQLEKVSLRDEMLNTFIKKKEQMGSLKMNSEDVCRIKRKLIVDFCHRFNERVCECFVRGQLISLTFSLLSLLREVPHIRDQHFIMGKPEDPRADLQAEGRPSPDPRTFQPCPRRLLSADGKSLLNLWFIPHYTEVLLMFRTLKEKERQQALQNSLQIMSALHDIVYYLVSFARLGNSDSLCSRSSTQKLTADWGGLESIGAELWDVQRQIESLCESSSSESVGRLLQLHRDVLFLRFDTAVRYMIRDAFLSSGNLSAYQSMTENMSHALPIMSDMIVGGANLLSVPQPLEAASSQAQKLYPWRSFLAIHGLHPLVMWDVSPIEHYMQLCLCDLNDRCRMEANGAILGVSLIMDDVLSSGRDAMPLQMQTTDDNKSTSDRELLDDGMANNKKKAECVCQAEDAFQSLLKQKGFLLLWKQMEVFKESWTQRQTSFKTINTPALFKHFSQLYRVEIFFPSMQALAQQMDVEKEYQILLSQTQTVLPPPGAAEVDIKAWQLLRLLEMTEVDMIRALQNRINTEMTLVMSERSRHDMQIPADLWKRPSAKHSVSLERPQIVEDFIQRLMSAEERQTDGQVTFSTAHLQDCLTELSCAVMNREKSVFQRYSQFYEHILQQQEQLLYQREQDVKELEAKNLQSSDPYRKVSDVCRGMMLEITALRAKVNQLEEEKRNLDQHLNLKHRERYDTLVHQLFSSCLLLKARLDSYNEKMDHDVRQLISSVRKEGVDRIIKLKTRLSPADDNQSLIHTLQQKELLEDLDGENSRLAALVCKLRIFSRWKLLTEQERIQKELLHWRLNEASCKTEAVKVKLISEQKEIVSRQELDAVKEALLQCQTEYEHIQKQITLQSQKLQDIEHRSARDAQSRQELQTLRMESVETLQEDVLDRESQLRTLSAQLQKHTHDTQIRQQRSHRHIRQVRGQLHQERSLKLEAFQHVDKLHNQIQNYEAALQCKSTVPSGRQSSSSRRLRLRNASAGLLRNSSVMSSTSMSFINPLEEFSADAVWRETWTPLDRPKTNSTGVGLDISEALLPSLPDGVASSHLHNRRVFHK
uniref:coiled-coil domain containing 162 isoform 2 n=1 Tax=Danio rerio TaxID=7955 RepID=UPI00403A150E